MGWLCERFGQFSVRFLGAALFLGALSAPALAANVNFTGAVGWSGDYATFVILTVDGIRNYDATGTSGKLRVEFWGGLQPFAGSFASQYQMATYDVGPLAAGAQTPRIAEVGPLYAATSRYLLRCDGTDRVHRRLVQQWLHAQALPEFCGHDDHLPTGGHHAAHGQHHLARRRQRLGNRHHCGECGRQRRRQPRRLLCQRRTRRHRQFGAVHSTRGTPRRCPTARRPSTPRPSTQSRMSTAIGQRGRERGQWRASTRH